MVLGTQALLVAPLQVLNPLVELELRPLLVLGLAFVLLVHRLLSPRRPSIVTRKGSTVEHPSQNPVPIRRQCMGDLNLLHLGHQIALVPESQAVPHKPTGGAKPRETRKSRS